MFVALDLPEEARGELVRWRESAFAGRGDVRLVPPEALHVTLVFLGYLPEGAVPRIAELMRAALPSADPPVLTAAGVRPVPPRRPRLFALDLADEDARACAVQGSIADALARAELYEPEERAFWPHITLARVRKGERAAPFAGADAPADPWRAEATTLYRSRLGREGARYEALARVPFPR